MDLLNGQLGQLVHTEMRLFTLDEVGPRLDPVFTAGLGLDSLDVFCIFDVCSLEEG